MVIKEGQEIHIHLPLQFKGIVHLHIDDEAEIATQPGTGDDAVSTSKVEAILQRFESYEPGTVARRVHEKLVSTGWVSHLPASRDGSESKSAYFRLVYTGSTGKRVTLYLNSRSLVSTGAKEREVVSALQGAEVHKTDIYIYHSEGRLQQALDAADSLRCWADGE
ncbi:MAG: hypothetical protein ACYCZV_11190 [Acidimicrobiales bacterium]